ncbi:NAD(P)H-binding protein [Rhizobium lusitanum]|uniref:NAD(P)H-binding protein n=2 Tax=Rhizobium lusitanum TaxID=293958 RepID=A0A6L9UAV5_9HYPH|nr:NAD(P)H-binding protein [Rhizobium lusitanum]
MFIVMGATGHVGRAVANALLADRKDVTVLTRQPDQANEWREKGALVLRADAEDVASMQTAFRSGRRAFLLNPPARPDTDTNATELRTARNILAALDGSGLEKVVAASTYGARPGNGIGDLTTLWELEEGLRRQAIPAAINRGAYYMSNWTSLADTVRTTGELSTMFPADTVMPMVAPEDLGQAAAARLLSSITETELQYVEGPQRYTPTDVANAFAAVFERDVAVNVIKRGQWKTAYRKLGFSDAAAHAYTRMTEESLDNGFFKPRNPKRGMMDLQRFVNSQAEPS